MSNKFGWGIVGILFIVVLASRFLSYNIPANILSVVVNKSLSLENVDAQIRQSAFRKGISLLPSNIENSTIDTDSVAMIPSLIQGLAAYQDDDFDTAVSIIIFKGNFAGAFLF